MVSCQGLDADPASHRGCFHVFVEGVSLLAGRRVIAQSVARYKARVAGPRVRVEGVAVAGGRRRHSYPRPGRHGL